MGRGREAEEGTLGIRKDSRGRDAHNCHFKGDVAAEGRGGRDLHNLLFRRGRDCDVEGRGGG
eukprot:1897786-Rhodomonas_salina.1